MSSSSPRTAMARDSKKKKKKKKRGAKGSDPTAKLTDDLLVEVISRVPYKSTCCCKCVSKRWRDLFSHPDHRKKLPHSLAGFFYESYNKYRFPRKARFFMNLSRQLYPFIDPSLSFLPKYESLDIVDSCNGLLLCRCWKATDPKTLDYIVCNPATEKWVVVPSTDWSCKVSCQVSVARLGFDPAVSSHFHVFEFIDQETWGTDDEVLRCGDDYVGALAIYSSEAGAWKYQTYVYDSFAIPENATSAFLNGILHLVAPYEIFIVAVDVEGDNWRFLDMPWASDYLDARVNGIFQSQGLLYIANSTAGSDGSEISFWVLEDYDTEEWTLKHNVNHLKLFRTEYHVCKDDYSVISIHPEHNLIFIVHGDEKTLISYCMDSMEVRFIRNLGSDCNVEWWPGSNDKTPFCPYVPLFSESLADRH